MGAADLMATSLHKEAMSEPEWPAVLLLSCASWSLLRPLSFSKLLKIVRRAAESGRLTYILFSNLLNRACSETQLEWQMLTVADAHSSRFSSAESNAGMGGRHCCRATTQKPKTVTGALKDGALELCWN